MAMNVTPFKSTDEFTMAGSNGKLADINSGVNNEVASALSGLAHIETGTYNGTGTYGASNPSQITFSFAPSWIIMLYVDGRYPYRLHLTDYGATSFLPMDALTTNYENTQSPSVQGYSADTTYAKKSADGKTLYWYNTNSAASQLNKVNDKIYYIAIG